MNRVNDSYLGGFNGRKVGDSGLCSPSLRGAKRRGNPEAELDCFAKLARTGREA